MIVRFKSFGPLRRLTNTKLLNLEVSEASTINDVLQAVIKKWGSAAESLIMDGNQVSGNLIIMLNMRDINTLEGLETAIRPDDEITVLPHVQGG